jgi:hypothetical protein
VILYDEVVGNLECLREREKNEMITLRETRENDGFYNFRIEKYVGFWNCEVADLKLKCVVHMEILSVNSSLISLVMMFKQAGFV